MTERVLSLGDREKERILKREEVSTGRLLMNIAGPIWGKERQFRGISLYAYIRGIEDEVDDGRNPEKAKTLLMEQLAIVKEIILGKGPNLFADDDNYLNNMLGQGIDGLGFM